MFFRHMPRCARAIPHLSVIGLYWAYHNTYPTIPCHSTYHAITYHTLPYHTLPYLTILYHIIPYHTIPYHNVYTLSHPTKLYHVIPYHTIPYLTIACHTYPFLPYHNHNNKNYHFIIISNCGYLSAKPPPPIRSEGGDQRNYHYSMYNKRQFEEVSVCITK